MLVTVSTHEDTSGLLVLAVDDEPHGLSELAHCLENNPAIRRIFTCTDATDALRLLASDDAEVRYRKDRGLAPVDAVFADLNMPGLSGMEMSRVFATLNPAPVLVFVTGHPEEAVNAFDLGAVDYVLKPCKQERLDKAIKRVLQSLQAAPAPAAPAGQEPVKTDDEVIAVELAGNTKLIPRANVRWVEAQGDYARLFTTDGSHLVRIPLAQLEERWEKAGFVRIHRSYLVALQLITELRMGQGGYQVVIGNEEKLLPVSRRHTRELKDRLVGSSRNS
ncbi:LytR/AlgR family response regulator transcription factor [Amycolatopsis magusensis]|uniref:LytR/AlgR family response regulator transcription factor n=1 Tax=Amycolatopsis magusensis TaxID=882444 RepID=UPI001AE846DD|nr:LytTR family DNA-binding domain-containing protein [Amycolatopsis magusensis]MDI5979102.1 LytTR family DNA-binding domain-containing protein [Amycolatopsis magusensis]UJW34347.1 LytTR family DNA-binding domain-containing protein [Saccharothrix sp. AJ9571]